MPEDIIEVETLSVACDGDSEVGGHPRVFLHLKQSDTGYEVVCPYCSKVYRLKDGVSPSAH